MKWLSMVGGWGQGPKAAFHYGVNDLLLSDYTCSGFCIFVHIVYYYY